MLNQLATEIHWNNHEAGWWDDKTFGDLSFGEIRKYSIPTKLLLVITELAEATEGFRKGLMDDHLPHREMFEVEMADAFIRLLDLAGATGIDLDGAIADKRAYNAQRADHKKENRDAPGGKAF